MPSAEDKATRDRVEELFHSALEVEGEERTGLLDRECFGEPALRRTVEELLESAASAAQTPLWQKPAIHDLAGKLERAEAQADTALDRYRLMERIGAGGMGVVYKAARADDAFSKIVAIKILRWDTGDPAMLRRFQQEREILAHLEHPNIARLLDGGTTADGRPYLAMEFVGGLSIDRYTAEKKLGPRETLELFREVCSAVSYAHRALVVHRDLKPANILVTPEGVPKLLDFGIARLLSMPQTDAMESTHTSSGAMTLEYASPEQVRSELVTTASDIYSLGVILYRLLTGERPYSNASNGVDLARAVCEQEPEFTNLKMDEDLINILRMALRKEPERRYFSVEQFSEDIRRYLDGLPILATPDTLSYRATKFLRRNKLAVGAAAVVLLTLMAGIMATAWQARSAQQARQLAERRLADIRQLSNSLVSDVHDAIADLPGTLAARQIILQRGVAFLDELAREKTDDPSLLMELAAGYNKAGSMTFDVDQALEAHRKALEILDRLAARDPHNRELVSRLAETYQAVGARLRDAGNTRGSLENHKKAVELVESLTGPAPTSEDDQEMLANVLIDRAMILGQAGHTMEAVDFAHRALTLVDQRPQSDPLAALPGQLLFVVLGHLTRLSGEQGNLDQSLSYAKRNLDWSAQLLQRDPSSATYRRDAWVARYHAANTLHLLGQDSAAEALCLEGLPLIEALAAADPGDKGHYRGIAVTWLLMGDIAASAGRSKEAQIRYAKAIAVSESLFKIDPKKAETTKDLAQMYTRAGLEWLRTGDRKNAAEALRHGRELFDQATAADPDDAREQANKREAYKGLSDLAR